MHRAFRRCLIVVIFARASRYRPKRRWRPNGFAYQMSMGRLVVTYTSLVRGTRDDVGGGAIVDGVHVAHSPHLATSAWSARRSVIVPLTIAHRTSILVAEFAVTTRSTGPTLALCMDGRGPMICRAGSARLDRTLIVVSLLVVRGG